MSTAEYDPFECVKTNVVGAMNVIDACINREVPNVLIHLPIKLVIQLIYTDQQN